MAAQEMVCPDCRGQQVRLDGGCPVCLQCGWSKC